MIIKELMLFTLKNISTWLRYTHYIFQYILACFDAGILQASHQPSAERRQQMHQRPLILDQPKLETNNRLKMS